MGAVTVDYQPNQPIYAFFAGWHQHLNASDGVNFTVIRTTVQPANVGTPNRAIVYNYTEGDAVALHGDVFVSFDRTFKPWVFHSPTFNHIVIVDPSTNHVFRVLSIPNQPLVYNRTQHRIRINGGLITGATYDARTHVVYVGTQGWGAEPGNITVIDVASLTIKTVLTLGRMESNPSELSLDYQSYGHLYVGLNGGQSILKVDITTWKVVAYATVPTFLRNIGGLVSLPNHVYFVTYEQHAKIVRIANANFCPHPCDGFVGYCNKGACACNRGYKLHSNGWRCEENASSSKSGSDHHGGEVALGILFAFAVVIAAAGWFLVYRSRSGRAGYAGLLGGDN